MKQKPIKEIRRYCYKCNKENIFFVFKTQKKDLFRLQCSHCRHFFKFLFSSDKINQLQGGKLKAYPTSHPN